MEIGERKYLLCSKLGAWPSVFENNTHAGVCQKLYSFSEPCFDRPHNAVCETVPPIHCSNCLAEYILSPHSRIANSRGLLAGKSQSVFAPL